MLIFFSILFIIYGIIIYIKNKKYFPIILKKDKDYKKVAKNFIILGAFLLFLFIVIRYFHIDITGIIMTIVVFLLICIKIIYSIITNS